MEIKQDIIKIKSLSVEKLQVGTAENPSGIVLFDRVTKKPYCVAIENGELVKIPGDCENNQEEKSKPSKSVSEEPVQE